MHRQAPQDKLQNIKPLQTKMGQILVIMHIRTNNSQFMNNLLSFEIFNNFLY